MTGIEVNLNQVITEASIVNGVTSVTITCVKTSDKEEFSLVFSGLDLDSHQNIKWLVKDLKLNDEIKILIKDVKKNSTPEKVETMDRANTITEGKLRAYKALKKELEELGVI